MTSMSALTYHHKPVLNPLHREGSTPDFLSLMWKCAQIMDALDSDSIEIRVLKTVDAAKGKLVILLLQRRDESS